MAVEVSSGDPLGLGSIAAGDGVVNATVGLGLAVSVGAVDDAGVVGVGPSLDARGWAAQPTRHIVKATMTPIAQVDCRRPRIVMFEL